MPAQVPKTQELGRFAASFRRLLKSLQLQGGGLSPWPPPGALPPGPCWELCPQTPVIGSRSALAMAWPPPMKISAYALANDRGSLQLSSSSESLTLSETVTVIHHIITYCFSEVQSMEVQACSELVICHPIS